MSKEDITYRLLQVKLQEILLCQSSSLPNDVKCEKIQELVGEVSRGMQQNLRSPEGRASDDDYFKQHGGLTSIANGAFTRWISQLESPAFQTEAPPPPPPRPATPPRSETPPPLSNPPSPPPGGPNLLQLSLDQNKVFLTNLKEKQSALEKAYRSTGTLPASSASAAAPSASVAAAAATTAQTHTQQDIRLELGQCDIFLPFLVTQMGVYSGQKTFQDVLVAGSLLFSSCGVNVQVGAVAKGIVLANAAKTADSEYAAVDPRAAACYALATLNGDENGDTSLEPLYQDPLAIAARNATNVFNGKGGEKNKAWLTVSKLKGACKTQAFLAGIIIVQIKAWMLISVEDWKEKFQGIDGRAKFFKDLEAVGTAITGKSILGLRITELIENVLVEGSFRKLSVESEQTLSECWRNLNEDMTSKTWLPQYGIAEADSLILANHDEPWTPPTVTKPIVRPYLSKDNKHMYMYRRTGVKLIVYPYRCLHVTELLIESGFPEDQVKGMALALLCTAPSELGGTSTYNFLMDGDDSIRESAAVYLRPAGPSKKDKGGPITKMRASLELKAEQFRNHHMFTNLMDDIRGDTAMTIDLFALHFKALEELFGSEEGNDEGEGEGEGEGDKIDDCECIPV